MGAPVAFVIVDQSTTRVVQGEYSWDRDNGGIMIPPFGASFPGSPEPGEWFWNTTDDKLYRRNDAGTAWVAMVGDAPVPKYFKQEIHVVTAGEVTAGYFTTDQAPTDPERVLVSIIEGPIQINKQIVGATGVTPDFDVLNTDEIHINNNGSATGLSEYIVEGDKLLVQYMTEET